MHPLKRPSYPTKHTCRMCTAAKNARSTTMLSQCHASLHGQRLNTHLGLQCAHGSAAASTQQKFAATSTLPSERDSHTRFSKVYTKNTGQTTHTDCCRCCWPSRKARCTLAHRQPLKNHPGTCCSCWHSPAVCTDHPSTRAGEGAARETPTVSCMGAADAVDNRCRHWAAKQRLKRCVLVLVDAKEPDLVQRRHLSNQQQQHHCQVQA